MVPHWSSERKTVAVLAVLVACATPVVAQTEAEKREAGAAYLGCLHTAAVKLDDQISDAASIGLGAAGACRRELLEYAKRVGRGVFELERGMRVRLEQEAHSRATAIVLAERAKRRAR